MEVVEECEVRAGAQALDPHAVELPGADRVPLRRAQVERGNLDTVRQDFDVAAGAGAGHPRSEHLTVAERHALAVPTTVPLLLRHAVAALLVLVPWQTSETWPLRYRRYR